MQEINRIADIYRPVEERVKDNNEVERKLTSIEVINQAGRCHTC
jgi:glutamate synthase (NADPH/NADH) small chain